MHLELGLGVNSKTSFRDRISQQFTGSGSRLPTPNCYLYGNSWKSVYSFLDYAIRTEIDGWATQ